MIEWLNSNNGAITAIATVVLAFITFWYALVTQQLLKVGSTPQVVAYIVPNRTEISVLEFVLANLGKGPAYNVTVEILVGREELLAKKGTILEPRVPILVIPQDEKIVTTFGSYFDLLEEPRLRPVTIRVSYQNSRGKKFSEITHIDISQYDGLAGQIETPLKIISSSIKKIEQTMSGWNMSRLKVETITSAENQKQREEWRKKAQAEREAKRD